MSRLSEHYKHQSGLSKYDEIPKTLRHKLQACQNMTKHLKHTSEQTSRLSENAKTP